MKTKEEIEQLAFKTYGDTLLKGSFMHGYTQCQEEMADKKYTEEDLRKAMIVVIVSGEIKGSKDIDEYINSLNKQDNE